MEQAVRVGIVGCGKISDCGHIPGLLEVEDAAVTALCDIVPERMDKARGKFAPLADATCFATDAELFASGLVDAVVVATPNDLHRPQALEAFAAGLHVLCEKPICATLAEADSMIDAAGKAGVVLQINQSLKFNDIYQTVVDLVKEGAIGEPLHARCIRGADSTPNEGWSPGADWFIQKKHQGGLLLDIGIHMADLLRMVMGDAECVAGVVDSRRPDVDVPDNVRALYRYKNGGTGVLELSWTLPGGASFFEVYGTKGRVRTGFTEQPIELWQKNGKEPEVSYPAPIDRTSSQRAFVQAIRGEAPTPAPGEYGRRALALCLAIEESSETGQFAEVKQFDWTESA